MPCAESERLLEKYQDAASKWSNVTEKTSINLIALAEALRQAALDTKKAYSDHRSNHGC